MQTATLPFDEIETTKTPLGVIELRKLDASWAPWTHQVNRYVDDGKDYGAPGRRVCIGTSNFGNLSAARAAYRKALGK